MKKGFTLIELLVVIAILAILSTVVVVIINPGELLRQARDTNRISDIASINSAIALYLADVSNPVLRNNVACTAGTRFGSFGAIATTTPFTINPANTIAAPSATTSVSGTGWVSVNFTAISSGSPLARLPVDPQNSQTHYYAYACGNGGSELNYEINARMESAKYATATSSEVVSNMRDGGDNPNWYEVGNNLIQ